MGALVLLGSTVALAGFVFRGASTLVGEDQAVADTRTCSRVLLASSHKHARALPGHSCSSLSSAGAMEDIVNELYIEYGRVYRMMCLARREIDGGSTPPIVVADYITPAVAGARSATASGAMPSRTLCSTSTSLAQPSLLGCGTPMLQL